MGQSQLFYLTAAQSPVTIAPQGFLARSFIVFNPNAFWVNFPSLQAAINPFSNGIVAPVPPTGSIQASTVTPPGLSADTLVGQTALIIASEDALAPGIWPVPPPSRPTPLWQGLSRLGNWTSAGAQPATFAINPPMTGIALLVYRTAGLGDFTMHAKGHTTGLDYLAMPGVSASQTQVATALIYAPLTPSTPGDSQLDFTWTDTGGFSYILFTLSPQAQLVSATGIPLGDNVVSGGLPLGVQAFAADSQGLNNAATGSQSKVVLAATGGKTYTLADVVGSISQTATTATELAVQVLDGATEIWGANLAVDATTGHSDKWGESMLGRKGTLGNSMTVQIASGATGINGRVSIGAFLR